MFSLQLARSSFFHRRTFISPNFSFSLSRSFSVSTRWISGRDLADLIERRLAILTKYFSIHSKIRPGLATILCGTDRSSLRYVARKQETAIRLGFHSLPVYFSDPSLINEGEFFSLISRLNVDSSIHGILVQLPIPMKFNENSILSSIDWRKDVDGFHPLNVGKLALRELTTAVGRSDFPLLIPSHYSSPISANIPCTPKACILMLEHYGIPIRGASVLIVNASKIVGLPLSQLLLHHGATVSVAHSQTEPDDLKRLMKSADILITAVGKANFVSGADLKENCTVLDVGINFVRRNSQRSNNISGKENPEDSKVGLMMVGD